VAQRSREVAARVQFIGFPHPRCDISPQEGAEEAEPQPAAAAVALAEMRERLHFFAI